MNYWLILIPLLSALTGWIIVRLFTWSLFHPLLPKKIAGFSFQGIIPKNKGVIAEKAGKLAAAEFQTFTGGLQEKISDPANVQKILPMIEEHVDDFLRNKLKAQMPMIGMFIGDKTITTMKAVFLKEIEELFPKVIDQYAGNLINSFNIEQLVAEKIAGISSANLEKQFNERFSGQVSSITKTAMLIGLFIGLVQLAIILLLS